ncbi:Cell division control protein 45 [Intoshia linei]|uniref:Cell division control protein 45 n=1 Tax=Intoshia linei TaxID=1819745 RepID=A0A177B9G2_9BILA|nr:Cell division control protein 45 [Intoshia linei]
MFLTNFEEEFYKTIKLKRLLIILTNNVDSICAFNILEYLLKWDNITYTMHQVQDVVDMKDTFMKHEQQTEILLLINCGITMDIVEYLNPKENVEIFICDSNAPFDLNNVYNQVQVKIIGDANDAKSIPPYDLVYCDDSEHEEFLHEKKEMIQKREQVLFEYFQYTYHTRPSAIIMYEMAWKLSNDSVQMLWLSIIGLTYNYLIDNISKEAYINEQKNINDHVTRYQHQYCENQSIDSLKITLEEDLKLYLYKQWNLYDSINNSPCSCNAFQCFSRQGKMKICEFFADAGIPLKITLQNFFAVPIKYKNNIINRIKNNLPRFQIAYDDMLMYTYNAKYGYGEAISAMDIAIMCTILVEFQNVNLASNEDYKISNLLLGYKMESKILHKCANKSIEFIKIIGQQAHSSIDLQQITSMGPFLYCSINEGSLAKSFVLQSGALLYLSRYIQLNYIRTKMKKYGKYPFVLSVNDADHILIAGLPPLSSSNMRNNLFAKAFEQAAINSEVAIDCTFFNKNGILKFEQN